IINPAFYDTLRIALFFVLAVDLLAASALVIMPLFKVSPNRHEARRALRIVALGLLAGLAPFCILSLGPYVLGMGYLAQPHVTILSLVLLPASLGGAILSRQFLGIERFIRRGLIALTVW